MLGWESARDQSLPSALHSALLEQTVLPLRRREREVWPGGGKNQADASAPMLFDGPFLRFVSSPVPEVKIKILIVIIVNCKSNKKKFQFSFFVRNPNACTCTSFRCLSTIDVT